MTINEAWRAGVDAVIADPTLNRGGFADAIRTVITSGFSNEDATAWIDAVATEYNRLGLIANPTYNNLRGSITRADAAMALFEALAQAIDSLPETVVASRALRLLELRDDRDQVNAAIDRCDELIDAEKGGTVGRLVKDVLRQGQASLRGYRETVRAEIQNLTGDPDS